MGWESQCSPSTELYSFGEATHDNLWDFPLPPGHKISMAQVNEWICESEEIKPVLKDAQVLPDEKLKNLTSWPYYPNVSLGNLRNDIKRVSKSQTLSNHRTDIFVEWGRIWQYEMS